MDTIRLDGDLGPNISFDLERELAPITGALRPRLTVDLSAAGEVHPAVVSVLMRHQRQARRQGGELCLIAPRSETATELIDQIGLCGSVRRSGS